MTASTRPSALDTAPEHGVTLWGAPGAGKSGLLGALYAASLRPEIDGWSAHPKDCEDEYTQQRLKESYLGLLGRSNAKTDLPAMGEYQPLRLVLRRSRARRSVAAMRVALVDPAGEFSTQLELGSTREGRALFARIARGGGVLWLFEPRRADDTSDDAVSRDVAARMLTLQHLVALLEQSGGQQLEIPVALCLSKADYLGEVEHDAARLDPAAALRAHLGETAFTWFEAVCPMMRCFAITSAGDVDGRVQPEGLDDVFDWLTESTRPRVSWRERMMRLIPVVPPAVRRTVGAVLLAGGLVGSLGVGVAYTGGPSTWLARLTPTHRVTLGGEVVRPAPTRAAPTRVVSSARPAERTLSADAAQNRLDRARDALSDREWQDALAALATDVPPPTLRFEWDSLYIAAALQAAAYEPDAAAASRMLGTVRARASQVVRRGPPGSRRLTPARYARAVACMDGNLGCPVRDVREDFTWALLGPESMRREARARLAALSDGGAP